MEAGKPDRCQYAEKEEGDDTQVDKDKFFTQLMYHERASCFMVV